MTGMRELVATEPFAPTCMNRLAGFILGHLSRIQGGRRSRPPHASALVPFKSRNSIRRLLLLSLSLASGQHSSPSAKDPQGGVQGGR